MLVVQVNKAGGVGSTTSLSSKRKKAVRKQGKPGKPEPEKKPNRKKLSNSVGLQPGGRRRTQSSPMKLGDSKEVARPKKQSTQEIRRQKREQVRT